MNEIAEWNQEPNVKFPGSQKQLRKTSWPEKYICLKKTQQIPMGRKLRKTRNNKLKDTKMNF